MPFSFLICTGPRAKAKLLTFQFHMPLTFWMVLETKIKHYFIILETRNMPGQKCHCTGSLQRWLLRNTSFTKRWKEEKNISVIPNFAHSCLSDLTYGLPGWSWQFSDGFSVDSGVPTTPAAVPWSLGEGVDAPGILHQTLLSFPAGVGTFSGSWEQLHEWIPKPWWLDLPSEQQLLFSSEGWVSPRMMGNLEMGIGCTGGVQERHNFGCSLLCFCTDN